MATRQRPCHRPHRQSRFGEVRAAASAVLDEIQAAGNLARVVVSGLVAEPITSEEELEVALGRIRDAVSAELAAGKQVRIQ